MRVTISRSWSAALAFALVSIVATPSAQSQSRAFQGAPITVDYNGTDLRQVLVQITQFGGLNLALDPSVPTGQKVDLSLKQVPWDQALDTVIRLGQLGYELNGKIVTVMSAEAMQQEYDRRQQVAKPRSESGETRNAVLRVGAPTYFSDGKTTGAYGSGWTLQTGKPLTLFVYSGKSMCESASPATTMPTDAGFGWQVTITPRTWQFKEQAPAKATDTLGESFDVTWQRVWDRGVKVTDAVHGPMPITLHKGERVLLDYLSGNPGWTRGFVKRQPGRMELSLTPATPPVWTRVQRTLAPLPSASCHALGMGLEIGLDGSTAPTAKSLMEADMWLVRTLPGAKELTQHQTLRLQPGESLHYYFDRVEGFPGSGASIDIGGALAIEELTEDKPEAVLTIAATFGKLAPPASVKGGSSTLRLNLTEHWNEVLSFPVPGPKAFFFFNNGNDNASPTVDKLELRMRTRKIR